jgi:predicted lipoprotein with Yx(FWY)xxD motif
MPVTANHLVGDGPTKMIGAKHGLGSPTVASILESPVAVAGKGPVARKTNLGMILANARGHTLYLFGKDRNAKSSCNGSCERFWPPLLSRGRPTAGSESTSRYSARRGAATAACR